MSNPKGRPRNPEIQVRNALKTIKNYCRTHKQDECIACIFKGRCMIQLEDTMYDFTNNLLKVMKK